MSNSILINEGNWAEYASLSEGIPGYIEYIEATDQITKGLKSILDDSSSPEEVSQKLQLFVSERANFTEQVKKRKEVKQLLSWD